VLRHEPSKFAMHHVNFWAPYEIDEIDREMAPYFDVRRRTAMHEPVGRRVLARRAEPPSCCVAALKSLPSVLSIFDRAVK